MRKIGLKNVRNNEDAKINEKTWHRRIGRELSGMSYNKAGGKKRKQSATAQLIVLESHWAHSDSLSRLCRVALKIESRDRGDMKEPTVVIDRLRPLEMEMEIFQDDSPLSFVSLALVNRTSRRKNTNYPTGSPHRVIPSPRLRVLLLTYSRLSTGHIWQWSAK